LFDYQENNYTIDYHQSDRDAEDVKENMIHFSGSESKVVLINNHFQTRLSNTNTLQDHNISLKFYEAGDDVPDDVKMMLFDLPETQTLDLRHKNDIIGSEFLAWHNLVIHYSILFMTLPFMSCL
jgi:hypothetical protein